MKNFVVIGVVAALVLAGIALGMAIRRPSASGTVTVVPACTDNAYTCIGENSQP